MRILSDDEILDIWLTNTRTTNKAGEPNWKKARKAIAEAQAKLTASEVSHEWIEVVENLLDGMGLGAENFKKSDWQAYQELKAKYKE